MQLFICFVIQCCTISKKHACTTIYHPAASCHWGLREGGILTGFYDLARLVAHAHMAMLELGLRSPFDRWG